MNTDDARFDLGGFIQVMRRLFQAQGVHLRELVQNALEAVYQAEQLGVSGGCIDITSDLVRGRLSVTDNGIGMTPDDLRTKLTVLFRSGWPQGTGKSLGIGQFGFGFYSTLLVADQVRVTSRARGRREGHRLTIQPDLRTPVVEP